MTEDQFQWLKRTCPYLKPSYLQYLSEYRFKTEQINIQFVSTSDDGQYGHVEIEAIGPWVETIMWEVPLMACLSEIFFRSVSTDWTEEGQPGNFKPFITTPFLQSLPRNCLQKGDGSSRGWLCLQRVRNEEKTLLSCARHCNTISHPCLSWFAGQRWSRRYE